MILAKDLAEAYRLCAENKGEVVWHPMGAVCFVDSIDDEVVVLAASQACMAPNPIQRRDAVDTVAGETGVNGSPP